MIPVFLLDGDRQNVSDAGHDWLKSKPRTEEETEAFVAGWRTARKSNVETQFGESYTRGFAFGQRYCTICGWSAPLSDPPLPMDAMLGRMCRRHQPESVWNK